MRVMARATHSASPDVLQTVRSALSGLLRRLARNRAERRLLHQLQKKSRRQLVDMGFDPDRIYSARAALDERPGDWLRF